MAPKNKGKQVLQNTGNSTPARGLLDVLRHRVSHPDRSGNQQQQKQPQKKPQPRKKTTATTEDATGSIIDYHIIQAVVVQIDPQAQLDPDVEDVLIDIADDFIEKVASFSCKLAKHRKSNVLEAKDVSLTLERHWNITVPGFGGDEYRVTSPAVRVKHTSSALLL